MTMSTNLTIYTDGGSRGNPGPAASAFIVYKNEEVYFSEGRYIGVATNNVAEYQALLNAFTWLKEYGDIGSDYSLTCYLDSELVVKQLTGIYKIKDQTLSLMAQKIMTIKKELNLNVSFIHVKRELNKEADKLVNSALDAI